MASINATDRRVAHFRAWLSEIQARGEDAVPLDVIERVRGRLGPPPQLGLLTARHVMLALRDLRLQIHLNDIPEIMRRINRIDSGYFAPPLDLPADVEADLIAKYERVCYALRRVNNASMSSVFVARKLLEEGGAANAEHVTHFPEFKSEWKRAQLERLWEQLSPFRDENVAQTALAPSLFDEVAPVICDIKR